MKIVEFENGRFGVRKLTLFGYRFLNIEIPHIWMKNGDPYFNQAMKSKYAAVKAMRLLGKQKNKVVNEEQSK